MEIYYFKISSDKNSWKPFKQFHNVKMFYELKSSSDNPFHFCYNSCKFWTNLLFKVDHTKQLQGWISDEWFKF